MSRRSDSLTTSAWRVAAASRRGSAHRDTANQDAVRTELVAGVDGEPIWVAAVSDGHGGPSYVRSDVGARLAVDLAVSHLRASIGRGGADPGLLDLLRGEVPAIVEGWRAAVTAHAVEHPFSEQEAARAGSPGSAPRPVVAYGATLIVALVTDHDVAVAQVGDGDVLVRSNGFAVRPVPGDSRLVAGETTSLCLDSAVDDFRFAGVPRSAGADLVLLATDGYGNSFADATWWHDLMGDLASFVAAHGFDELERRFPDWLEESAVVGGDDVTGVVVARDPLVVEPLPTAPEPVPPVALPHVPPAGTTSARPVAPQPPAPAPVHGTTQGSGTRGQRRTVVPVVLAVVVLVLVVLLAVRALTGEDAPTPGGPVTSESPAPSESPSPTEGPEPGGRASDGPDRPPAGDPDRPDRVGGDRTRDGGAAPPPGGAIGQADGP